MRVASAAVLALVAATLSCATIGCVHAPRLAAPGVAEHVRESSAFCFRSVHGIEVFAPRRSDCPRPRELAADTAAVLRHAGLDGDALRGARVVYVRGAIDCSGIQTFGCTDVNRRVSIVSLDTPWPRRLTQHELGHQAVRACGMPDRHQDHGDPWWRSPAVSVRRR